MGYYKVAVATSDGRNVDTHFGHASVFTIYFVNEEDGSFEEAEERHVRYACSEDCTKETAEAAPGGHAHGSAMDAAVEALGDVDYVLAARIGPYAVKSLARRGIAAYDICLPVDQAIYAIHQFRSRRHRG